MYRERITQLTVVSAIMTPMVRGWLPSDITKDWDTNPDIRLDPDSIANVSFLTYALRSNHDSCE